MHSGGGAMSLLFNDFFFNNFLKTCIEKGTLVRHQLFIVVCMQITC